MTIAVYVPFLAERSAGNFIVETFFSLFELGPAQKLILITDDKFDSKIKLTKTEVVIVKPQPRNPLLKKLWVERTLMSVVNKYKADLFISAGSFCSLKTSLPQVLLVTDTEKTKLEYAKKAIKLIALNESERQQIITKLKIDENKIVVVYPSVNEKYIPIDPEKKEQVKTKYSDGKEFFLYNSSLQQGEDIISLLKSFSHFKKRQQSSF